MPWPQPQFFFYLPGGSSLPSDPAPTGLSPETVSILVHGEWTAIAGSLAVPGRPSKVLETSVEAGNQDNVLTALYDFDEKGRLQRRTSAERVLVCGYDSSSLTLTENGFLFRAIQFDPWGRPESSISYSGSPDSGSSISSQASWSYEQPSRIKLRHIIVEADNFEWPHEYFLDERGLIIQVRETFKGREGTVTQIVRSPEGEAESVEFPDSQVLTLTRPAGSGTITGKLQRAGQPDRLITWAIQE